VDGWANISQPAARVRLNSMGQYTLEWETPLHTHGVTVEPGTLNLYTYPGSLKEDAAQLAVVHAVVCCLAREAPRLFEAPDPVGACAIHALLVCNTTESLELAFDVLSLVPRLLLVTHVGQPFEGETCLHILAANRREAHACRMVDLALQHCSSEACAAMFGRQALGVFFDDEPMRWYGESPLAYACVFGLRQLVRKLVETGLVSLSDNVGGVVGLYPLHAVAANGLADMYDFLTRPGGADCLRVSCCAAKLQLSQAGRQVALNTDGMTPLQLVARLGLRFMYQHIMRREHTRILWTWGPVTQYQIELDGIDSSGEGAADVMEIITREDAPLETQEFILDAFMGGFMFTLFQQKWRKYGWYLHLLLMALDTAVVVVTAYLCVAVKNEVGEKQLHSAFVLLLGLLGAFLAVEMLFGLLFASNMRSDVTTGVVMQRTWSWMKSFSVDTNVQASLLLAAAALVYWAEAEAVDKYTQHLVQAHASLSSLVRPARALQDAADEAAELPRWVYTKETEAERVGAITGNNIDSAVAASWDGIEPLAWLLLGIAFLFKCFAYMEQAVRPFTSLSVFLLSVRQVLRGPLIVFMNLFLVFMATFVLTMITIYPDHHARGKLPQAPELLDWVTASYAIIMAGFTGEPLDLNLQPDFIRPLGTWQIINIVFFILVYMLYTFLSLILLLNLLIALLATTFAQTQAEATLQGRMAFARITLRLELLADVFGIDTWSGEALDGDRHVHAFREVIRDQEGERARYAIGEDIFDARPAKDGASATEPSAATVEVLERLKDDVQELKADLTGVVKALKQLAATPARAPPVERPVERKAVGVGSAIASPPQRSPTPRSPSDPIPMRPVPPAASRTPRV